MLKEYENENSFRLEKRQMDKNKGAKMMRIDQ